MTQASDGSQKRQSSRRTKARSEGNTKRNGQSVDARSFLVQSLSRDLERVTYFGEKDCGL